MTILVTGASGFIGSNLSESLLEQGKNVIGMDKDRRKRHLLANCLNNTNFDMIWDDINNIENYADKCNDLETIYHLAASANIRKSFTDTRMDLDNNVLGTYHILELMRRLDVEELVFSSSSSIYGETDVKPTPEDLPDICPISLYGASKLANEAYIHAFSHLYGIRSWMFRFANVVGRHQHRGVIVDFFKKIQKDQSKLEILGDGNQEKSFFDVFDCVNGLLYIPEKDGKNRVEIYNLGNMETMKIKDLAKIVCDELKVNPEFVYTGGDRGWPGDTPYTILSIDKALEIGWKPKYDCEEAIRRTVRYLTNTKKI